LPIRVSSIATAAGTFGSKTEDLEVSVRTKLANARFQRLLDYCADALGESIRASDELSQHMSYLRKEIESDSCLRPTVPTADPLVPARPRGRVETDHSRAADGWERSCSSKRGARSEMKLSSSADDAARFVHDGDELGSATGATDLAR